MLFDIQSDLPTDPLLLEASAGTGKTWAIAALTTRFLAEARASIDEVVLITFTDRAARDLRSRVFSRIEQVEADLTRFRDSGNLPADEISSLLASSDVDARVGRLRAALDHFDRAMVTTIHSFCESTLKELGVLGDWDSEDTVLADPRKLIEQCAIDVFLARYSDASSVPIEPARALKIAKAACESSLPLESSNAEDTAYGQAVREHFTRRKRELGVVTFDDMPQRLADLLASPDVGPAAIEALRDRYKLVMVDEFQDTDPIQWQIIRQAFMSEGRPTILIGDPKQSIYGFRNADLLSYLDAGRRASTRATLGKNFRSDKAVTDGVAELFGNVHMGSEEIVVTEVASKHTAARFDMRGSVAKVMIRRSDEDQLPVHPNVALDRDVVTMTQQLLADATIGENRLSPSDIAILVRSGAAGRRILEELHTAGVPAVAAGQESVWASSAASDWMALLDAMATPKRSNIVMAACSDLLGMDLGELLDVTGNAGEEAANTIANLTEAHSHGGFSAVLAAISPSLQERVVQLPDGQRQLTDLLHIGELLACAPASDLQDLIDWAARQQSDADDTEHVDRRLASDSEAVRVMTMHSAKGLEFGVVLLPEVSNLNLFPSLPFPYVTQDQERRLWVGPRPGYRDPLFVEHQRQQRDEELRLLYVGLTRARHLTIAWHLNSRRSRSGALTALLARDRSAPELAPGYSKPHELPDMDPRKVFISSFNVQAEPSPMVPATATQPLVAARFMRSIDTQWRRTSYSGLTANAHEAAITMVTDEPEPEMTPPPAPSGELALRSPMADLPGGAAFGNVVHAAFEELDWSGPNLVSDASRLANHLAPRHGLDQKAADLLAESLVLASTTPLGPLFDGVCLSDLPLDHRLPELDFDLPLANSGPAATVAALASLMAEHLPADDVLVDYPDRLANSAARAETLSGILTGSIDAVLQTPSGRFTVVDYKTNRLPTGPDEELTVGHYQRPAMAEAMMLSHYPLQALLYCVALHRYLSWRLPIYDPDTHLGGVGYLFVRGMAGPETPMVDDHTCGVFTWHPPTALVLAASDLLEGAQ